MTGRLRTAASLLVATTLASSLAVVALSFSPTPAGAAGCTPSATVICITTTSPLQGGTVGSAYAVSLTSSGGAGSITWSLFSGAPPPGITVNPTGSISGNPAGAGTFSFTVEASDTASHSATALFSLTIAKGSTSVAPLATPNESALNQVVTYSAVVGGAGSVSPTGTVTFTSNPAGTLSGGVLCTATVASGNASCTANDTPMTQGNPSTDTITATYGGDGNFTGSNSTTTATVNQGTVTTTQVTVAPTSTPFNTSVLYTATVSGSPSGSVTFSVGSTLLCPVPSALSGGVATCTSSLAPGGSDTVTAIYSGTWDPTSSTGFDGSTGTTPLTVTPASDTMTANVSAPTSTFGQSLTYSTTVTSGAGTPTGTVSFAIGSTALCTATLSGGAGSCPSNAAPVGADNVVATYGGTPDFESNSQVATVTVGAASTSTVVATTPSSSTIFGTSVSYSATVSVLAPGSGQVNGTVTFTTSSGAVSLCQAPISNGTGSCSATNAPVGSDTIVGTFAPTASFSGSTGNVALTVGQATPTITASASPTSQSLGNSIAYSATVTSSVGTPTGIVGFAIFGSSAPVNLCSATLSSHTASCSTAVAPIGANQVVVAVYEGDTNFVSNSTTTKITVTKGVTSTTAGASPTLASFGSTITYSSTVTSIGGTPTGTVTYTTAGPTTLCTATLSGGSGSCTATNAPLGDDSVTATYNGSSSFLTATAMTSVNIVSAAATTTTLTPTPNSDQFGQSVSYGVTVTAAGATPTGTVVVTTSGGALTLCTITLSNGSGACSVTTAPIGADSILASFTGNPDIEFGPSSDTESLLVSTDSTATAVTAVPSPSTFNGTVTYSATVTNQVSGTPTGSVIITTGSTTLCTVLTLTAGSGSCTATNAPLGVDPITASYGGDSISSASVGTTTLTVNQAPTVTNPEVTPSSPNFGAAVLYSVSVTSAGGTPTGQVVFQIAGSTVCTATLSSGAGSCTASSAPAGTDTVTATYGGDTNFLTSSATTPLTVAQDGTTTTVTSLPTSTTFGTSVSYMATVTSSGGTPTGTVVVTIGSVNLCTITLSTGSGSCNSSAAPTGSDTINGAYSGDNNFIASSDTASLTVSKANTTAAVSASPSPGSYGGSETFTSTLSSAGGTPTGTVTITAAATTLCTITLSSGTGTCPSTSTPVGSNTITATYNGDTNFKGSVKTTTLVINKATSSVSAAAQPSVQQLGQPVAFSATVTSPAGVPTGTVTFTTNGGALQLCQVALSNGNAACSATNGPLGDNVVSVTYSGDGNFDSSNSTAPFGVGPDAPAPPAGNSGFSQATSPSSVDTGQAQLSGSSATGAGLGALTLASFATDPEATAPALATGSYWSVTTVGLTSASVAICNLGAGQALDWWNGTTWVVIKPQSLSTPTGCVSFTLTPLSSPGLSGLGPIYLAVTEAQGPESGAGYWLAASDGGIFGFGDVGFYGSTGALHLNKPIVGMAPTPDRKGYWLVASDGGIFAFGDAAFYGSTGAIHLNKPIVGMTTTPDGRGYWLVASDGGIFGFGDAAFFGSTGAIHLNQPIVSMAPTPDGQGYWLVASDGGIFGFGDAAFDGSTGAIHLNKPIVSMAVTPDGKGYWLVASDGGIFGFGDATFYGSTGGTHLNQPIVAMTRTPDGGGYWLTASDGGIFGFGDATFYGSTGGTHLNEPIVTMAEG